MGKKRIIKKTEKELLQEREKIEETLKREPRVKRPTQIQEGRIYISSSYNNTLITLTDPKGNVLTWSSAGKIGFRGTKKGTPFAASKVAEVISDAARRAGMNRLEVMVRGIGSGRDSALRSLAARGLDIIALKDVTPIPHNGCRPPKVRRV